MPNQEEMSIIDHIKELRKRIVRIVLMLVITIVGGLFCTESVIDYLNHAEPASNMSWNVFSPWDAIRVYMEFAFIIALLVSLPYTMYQIWSYVKPGLRLDEQKATLRYIPGAVVLFLMGLSFAYFIVFPMAFHFTSIMTTRLGLIQTYGVTQYFSFMFHILLPV
ncbi:MAG: twin-arginine translocase subunit TatC, partial [Bacilli bacterium]